MLRRSILCSEKKAGNDIIGRGDAILELSFTKKPDRMMSKARWKVAGAFRKPKG